MLIIKRIRYVTGETSATTDTEIETHDVEALRAELHRVIQCDRILFSYYEINKTQ